MYSYLLGCVFLLGRGFMHLHLNTIKQTPRNLVPEMIPTAALIALSREIA